MKGVFNLNLIGRLGNTLFSTAFALAYCQRHDLELRIEGDSILEKVFELKFGRFKERFPDRLRNETTLDPAGEGDVEFQGYCQNQKSLIYTGAQAKEWFRFRSHIQKALCDFKMPFWPEILIHLRHGDYKGYGYPMVSLASYKKAIEQHARPGSIGVVSEESPVLIPNLPSELKFLPDFYRLIRAPILFRANSSFSWWAAVIGNHEKVFSPIIDGLEGGKEHDDVLFAEGNWPKLANLDFCSDLHLEP